MGGTPASSLPQKLLATVCTRYISQSQLRTVDDVTDIDGKGLRDEIVHIHERETVGPSVGAGASASMVMVTLVSKHLSLWVCVPCQSRSVLVKLAVVNLQKHGGFACRLGCMYVYER